MQIDYRKEGDLLIVRPEEKRLDASVATEFKRKMADLIGEGNEFILLDLSRVSFMDSSGLGAIVSILKTLGRRGELILCGLQEPVLELFKLTRMNRIFQIFKDEKEAISSQSK